jgi:hypothetical protein
MNALVFADWGQMYALEYVFRIERDIHTVEIHELYPGGNRSGNLLGRSYQELIQKSLETRPVILTTSPEPDTLKVLRVEHSEKESLWHVLGTRAL